MGRMKAGALFLSGGLLVMLFQNCSRIHLEDMQSALSAKSSTGEQASGVIANPGSGEVDKAAPDVIDQVIAKNPACATLDFEDAHAQDRNYSGDGGEQKIAIKNVKELVVHGHVSSLAVDGALDVTIGGRVDMVCVRAQNIDGFSGSKGQSEVPVVLIGDGESAKVESISGDLASDLVLVDVSLVGPLNAKEKNVYLRGAQVESIKGNGGDLYLLDDSNVKSIEGTFAHIYISQSSQIQKLNAKGKVIGL